ncbi:MAG: phytoene/squalene synthase family protein [Gemmatimonadales bacterium]|jgi:farnesyl-diphosphate farnesyltransferase
MTGTVFTPDRAADRAFCAAMLPKVSRTFALCIRLLPQRLEHPVLTAYLLCRIADTIEDAATLPPSRKDALLAHFARCLEPDGPDAEPLRETFAEPANDHERLARSADIVLREFQRLSAAEREAVRPWVQEMAEGMAEFAARGGDVRAGSRLEVLGTVEDLDRYCYYVAGTVGHLLTALFRVYAPAGQDERFARLETLATSFGLGLQLTNIIKDVADDRRRGWSFVPRELCQVANIRPEDLQDPRYREAGRRVMLHLIDKAKHHLVDALDYATVLTRRPYGVRLFCLTSLYFAVQTLRLAEGDERLLDPGHKVKISRAQVYRTVLMTRLVAASNTLVRWQFRRLAGSEWRRGNSLVSADA